MSESFVDDGQRYRLDSRIATGGMGEVWRATDTVLSREVAVKLLKNEYADDPTFRSRFETEARHAAALHHPGVAGVYDFGEAQATDGSAQPRPFLVMELVNGQPLSALLADGRELDPDAVQDLLAQAGDALGAAHAAGIVHRDVKPANLIVTPAGKIKITDFGIARAADGVQMTQTGAVMGTPQYLSPEQARGETATPASDVYALGVVAFECLVGRRPFEADSPVATALAHLQQPVPELPGHLPTDLAAVVRRSLSKDPAERYADGSAFATALRDPATELMAAPTGREDLPPVAERTQVMGGVAPAAAPVPVSDSTDAAPVDGNRKVKRWTGLIIAAVVLLVLVVVLATILLTGGDGDEEPAADDTRERRTPSQTTPPTQETSEPPPSSSAPPPTPTVDLNPADYQGRDIDDVEGELEGLNLGVQRSELDNDGTQTEGAVDSINPSGTVEEGTTITVSYFGPPAETTPPTPDAPDTSVSTPPGASSEEDPTPKPKKDQPGKPEKDES